MIYELITPSCNDARGQTSMIDNILPNKLTDLVRAHSNICKYWMRRRVGTEKTKNENVTEKETEKLNN